MQTSMHGKRGLSPATPQTMKMPRPEFSLGQSIQKIEDAVATQNPHEAWMSIIRAFHSISDQMGHWVIDLSGHAVQLECHQASFQNAQMAVRRLSDWNGDMEAALAKLGDRSISWSSPLATSSSSISKSSP